MQGGRIHGISHQTCPPQHAPSHPLPNPRRQKTIHQEHLEEKKLVTQYSVREELKQSVRILLAEDNPVNQKLAMVMLTKAGYKVTVVPNGRLAVETFTEKPDDFDTILMDIQMPEMDGYEATRQIRQQGFTEIPIIAMTANAMKGDKELCLEAGMSDYITKPIKREIVFQILEKWLHLQQLNRRTVADANHRTDRYRALLA